MNSLATRYEGAVTPRVRWLSLFEKHGLALAVCTGFIIRLYLSLTNYCISGDGAAYIRMAQDYYSGDWRKPLGAVFSPLYPLLIAGAHAMGLEWELAGNLVSALVGTGAIVTVYLMICEAFEREDLALGAAALTAIHPGLAAYSASVRTEAGYILLITAVVGLLLKAVCKAKPSLALLAGVVGGMAYLYRTEGILLLVIATIFPSMVTIIWRIGSLRSSIMLSLAFGLAALAFVAPYAVMLHATTGHWTVGREFTAAIMYGIGSSAKNPARWRDLGFSASASPLAMLAAYPGLYLKKVCSDVVMSFYGFVQAAGPVVIPLLAIGLWVRGRKILNAPGEVLLVLLVVCYFGGFILSATGARFMLHLIPYTFGWVILGLETLTIGMQRLAALRGWRLSPIVPAVIAMLILLPQTLWPIGYDMRGVRYAGEAIASKNPARGAVVARDGRVAWYANAPFVALPSASIPNLCEWMKTQEHASYLLIGERDEHHFAVSPATACLDFVRRYPRYGTGYYDLYAVHRTSREQ
jgi:hypothetical protein